MLGLDKAMQWILPSNPQQTLQREVLASVPYTIVIRSRMTVMPAHANPSYLIRLYFPTYSLLRGPVAGTHVVIQVAAF
jgi:hypothetical protein